MDKQHKLGHTNYLDRLKIKVDKVILKVQTKEQLDFTDKIVVFITLSFGFFLGLSLVVFIHFFEKCKVLRQTAKCILRDMRKFTLSQDEIEILKGDAIEYAMDKKYPDVFFVIWLIPCLICQSYRKFLKQVVSTFKNVVN